MKAAAAGALNTETLRYLKTGKTSSDERTSVIIEEIAAVFRENITPKNVYSIYDCKIDSSAVTLGGMTIASLNLAKHLEGCHRAVLLAATLGAGADILIRKYTVQDMEKALIAQAVCAAMIEAYLDETENDLFQANELKGLHKAARYSPGYGDFNISCQKGILTLLGASRIGLSLTDGYMLTPTKSVTAVIGFSEERKYAASKCKTPSACASCTDKNCAFREEM